MMFLFIVTTSGPGTGVRPSCELDNGIRSSIHKHLIKIRHAGIKRPAHSANGSIDIVTPESVTASELVNSTILPLSAFQDS